MTRHDDIMIGAAPGPHRLWHVAFVAVPAICLVAGAVGNGGTVPLWGVAALAAVPAAWFAVGRRSFADRRVWIPFTALLLGLLATSIMAAPTAANLTALVYPFVWTAAPTLRQAIAANLAITATLAGAFLAVFGPTPAGVAQAMLIALLTLGFSLVFGTWISRIEEWGAERDRLLGELRDAQESLAALHRDTGATIERERLSRELHDTLTQSLTGLVMLTRGLADTTGAPASLRDRLRIVEDVAAVSLAESRALIAATAPVDMGGGLPAALERLAARLRRETALEVDIDAGTAPTLAKEEEVVLLRCAQEAVANVRKHAAATRVVITVRAEGADAVLTVVDDGRGIDDDPTVTDRGFGLAGMRDRLVLVGGTMRVARNGPAGTRLEVRTPRHEEETA